MRALSLSASLNATILSLFAAAVAFCVLLLIGTAFGFSPTALVRDPSATHQTGWAVGAISRIGIVLMSCAALAAFVAAARSTHCALFLCVGVFASVFAIDDALLLHERLGSADAFVYIFYGALALAIGQLARTAMNGRWFSWPYLAFFGCFIGSAVIDVGWEHIPFLMALPQGKAIGYILEDALKFVGICDFAHLWLSESVNQMRVSAPPLPEAQADR